MTSSSSNQVVIQHRQPYRQVLISELQSRVGRLEDSVETLKDSVETLEDSVETLEDEARQKREIMLKWETYSRISQGLNDHITLVLPLADPSISHSLSKLKNGHCGFLPLSLTAWALHRGEFSPTISDEAAIGIYAKIRHIHDLELTHDMDIVWGAIPPVQRTLIITMWARRLASNRALICHAIPSVDEALQILDSDTTLSEAEVHLARVLIPIAVNKEEVRLFTDSRS